MKYSRLKGVLCASLILTGILTSSHSMAYELGLRGDVVIGDGTPANDILGLGVYTSYGINPTWSLLVALDYSKFDYERPWKTVGLKQSDTTGTIDASATSNMLSVHLQRSVADYNLLGATLRWSMGLGINQVDVDDASGPLQGGGEFNVETKTDTEWVILAGMGLQWRLSALWNLDTNLGIQHHFADWKTTDTRSGAEGSISDYTAWGLRFGLSRNF